MSIPVSLELLRPVLSELAGIPQDPLYHGEGDVLSHTRLVLEGLEKLPSFLALSGDEREILRIAAALHDLGKKVCTRLEGGRLVSPGHARAGAEMARLILWRDFGLCGTPEKQNFRETVCQLIRCHSLPPYAIENESGKLRLLRAAANGEMIPSFTVRLLCVLSEADALGRACDDKADMLDRIALCVELAKEAGCYDGPYPFPTEHTAYACLSGKNISPEYPLYDGTWGEVILLSGLPGTGKDTWIKSNCPDLPMISLDEIRKELNIPPTQNQVRVIDAARERASFFIDSDGVLMDFDCGPDNGHENGELLRLNIPEGVTAIPGDMFVNCRVLWEMTLPESLKCIGCGAGGINTFACSLLPDVVLPENLELFGRFAFGASYIRSLTFPRNLKDSLYAVSVREFKDSHIMELRVPAECREHLNGNITGWGWPKIEISELTDPKLGAMCCLKAADGMIMGEGIVPQVINALRFGEEEIN